MVHAVRAACGLDQNSVIVAEPEAPNAPRPALPYFTLKILTPAMMYGTDEFRPIPDTTTQNVYGPRGMVVSFNAYGRSHEEAYSYATLWQAALGTQTTRESLAGAGIAVWRPGNVGDLSVVLNTGYEGRAHLDCTFGLTSNVVEDTGQITSVDIGGTVSSASISVNVSI